MLFELVSEAIEIERWFNHRARLRRRVYTTSSLALFDYFESTVDNLNTFVLDFLSKYLEWGFAYEKRDSR